MSKSHRRLMARTVIATVAVAAIAAATFVIGRWTAPLSTGVRSADEPAPTVTVTAHDRTITTSLQVTATVRPAAQYSIPVARPAGVARLVVTAVPTDVGATVTAGTVLAEISGRPVIALPGKRPTYRDVTTGDSGPDVSQLQNALASLGYQPETDGTFGPATGKAVAAFYHDRGYSALERDTDVVSVPAGEIVSLPHLPVTLTSLPGDVGASAEGASITVQSAAPGVVVAQLGAAASAQTPGHTPVVLHCGGTEVNGRLGPAKQTSSDSDGAGAASDTAIDRAVTISSPDPHLNIGTTCAGTATVAVTSGKVLAVPASAVYDSIDQGPVVRLDSDGGVTTVPVSIGQSGDGWLEIEDPPPSIHPGVSLIAGTGSP